MGLGYVHRFFKVRCLNEVERHYGPVTRRSGRISQANALVAQDARFEPRPSFICCNAQALTSSVRRFCSSSERVLWPWRKIKTNPAFMLAPCCVGVDQEVFVAKTAAVPATKRTTTAIAASRQYLCP